MSTPNPSSDSEKSNDVVDDVAIEEINSSVAPAQLTKARQKAQDAKDRKAHARLGRPDSQNPAWLVPTMLTLLVGGLVWIVVFYVTSGLVSTYLPIPAIGQWNLAVGFGFILAGGILSTRYK